MGKNRNVALEDPPKLNKNLALEDPPSASSSDDEDMSDTSSDNEVEPSNPSVPVAAVKEVSNSESSSDEEDLEDSVNGNSGKNQTPSAHISVSVANEGSDSGESETESDSETESAKPNLKRPIEEASASVNVKRAKIGEKEMEPDTETKKAYFQRLWSEEDEIVILQGMINFKSDTGKNPSENMNGFYESVKKSITYEAKNLNQFISKIHSLKKKFNAKMKKGDKLSFAKPHDEKCFELSKLIWRSDLESTATRSVAAKSGAGKSKKKINVESKINVQSLEPEGEEVERDWFENSFLVSSIVGFGMDEEYVKRKWSLVPVEVKKKIEEKWKVLEGKRVEFALEKIALVHEVASMLP